MLNYFFTYQKILLKTFYSWIFPTIHKKENENLYVIAVVFNPKNYNRRYELYKNFEKYIKKSGAILYTIELAIGDSPFVVTNKTNKQHIQLRTDENNIMWHKENLINICISKLPHDWKYVAWIDADLEFEHKDWVSRTTEKLKTHPIVQMFSHGVDLGPNDKPFYTHNAIIHSWEERKFDPYKNKSYEYWHPGYAWAATKDFINASGGLIDWGILGSSDRHMACSMIGRVQDSIYPNMKTNNPEYYGMCNRWQSRVQDYFKTTNTKVGYIHGKVFHFWHGKKENRGYGTRWRILVDHKFSPLYHLKKDWNQVYNFDTKDQEFKNKIIQYFERRKEDEK